MIRKLIVAVLVFTSSYANAQQQLLQDVNGNPFTQKKLDDVRGESPFFNDDFFKGTLKVNNLFYNNLLLKYDQLDNRVIYKKDTNSPLMEPSGKVEEFTLEIPSGEVLLFRRLNNSDEFYQVLQDGKTMYLKQTKKLLMETTSYSSGTKERSINSSTKYFIFTSNKELIQVKKDKKDIMKVLKNQETLLEKYISSQEINFKLDKDVAKLVAYYNTL